MKNVLSIWIGSILLLVAYAHTLKAQDLAPGVYLKDGSVLNVVPTQKWIDSVVQTKPAAPVQTIISFDRLPTQQERSTLLQAGITLSDYIPNNSFIAFVRFPVNTAAISTVPVRGIINMRPEWKMDNAVRQLQGATVATVLVAFHPVVTINDIKEFIASIEGQIVQGNMEGSGAYLVSIAPVKLRQLVQWYGVLYINTPSKNELLDIAARGAQKGTLVAAPVMAGGYGLLGDSIAIAIGDDAPGIYHVDLKERVINYNPAPMNIHGVHVNGLAGGSGLLDPYARGMAPHVTLVDHQFDNVLAATGTMYQAHGIVATNNSYATQLGNCNYMGTYDVYSRILDTISNNYRNVLHVFASANDGALTCSPYPQGFGTVSGGYQTSKNALVVGNSNKLLTTRYTSSTGPTRDGRLKPEVSAVGVDVYSTVNVDEYRNETGTSMACPNVTGSVALLAQRYKQLHGNTPPSDIAKALMANGATDYGNPGPDFKYGFGFINLYRSLQILDNNRYQANTIGTGAQQDYTISVPANTALLKVMLYWNDAPASPMAQHQLVNDLDLSVQTPSGIRLPLVLDTLPANVNNNAAEGIDHVNNCEQVVIANPSGSYTIHVNGYHTPSGSVPYVVAYDFVPVGIRIDYPYTGTAANSNDTVRIYWDASDDNNTFTLQYSTNNGAGWNTISNSVPATQRYYNWFPGGISSGGCQVRLLRNNTNQQFTTGSFVLNPPCTVTLDSLQCPGYIAIHWQPVPNAMAYQVWQKVGIEMSMIDMVNATDYAVKGLHMDSTYYIAVSPIIGGLTGNRSVAVGRRPNTGTCTQPYSMGDLMLQQIVSPNSGRLYTSSALSANTTINVLVRNLYNAACTNYTVSYSINGGTWLQLTGLPAIPANDTLTVSIPNVDLAATVASDIRVAVQNLSLTDPVQGNDSLTKTVRNILNDPITLAFTDGFETMDSIQLLQNTIGFSLNGIWDYEHSADTGRLRTSINSDITISGNRSISLDDILSDSSGIQNYLTGTFNLSNYSAQTSEVRFEFDYVLHGKPKFTIGNDVWVRGSDTQPWLPLYAYKLNSDPGEFNNSGTLSLSDAMLHSGQDFSSSLQIRLGQHDTSVIALRDYGNGMTIDNIKLYTVQNDIQLTNIIAPQPSECGLGNETSLIVKVKNGVNIVLNDIHLFCQLDNGAVTIDTLASLGAKDSIVYTFKKKMDLSALGLHTLNVWIAVAGDTYTANDSILNYQFHNQPLITAFPYLQNFEANDGYWYTDGIRSSWQYGTPATTIFNKAASGTKVWKTNLTGKYNSLEQSYLYSPCFDIAALGAPMLSFSVALDLEDCDPLCDAAYVEYSFDGITWTKLGEAGQGTNWYNNNKYNVWNEHGNTRWRVASIPLPKGNVPIRLRFVMHADPGFALDGIAIDDIHVYDRQYSIYTGNDVSLQNDLATNLWTNFLSGNSLISQMQPTVNIKNVSVNTYRHNVLANPGGTQYLFPVSFVAQAPQPVNNMVNVRLYITEADFVKMLNDSSCPSCTKPEDAYRLGITQYSNRNASLENGSLDDNTGGQYFYHPGNEIQWVPYDAGYYAQTALTSFSELWFNDGGPLHNTPAAKDYLTFDARKITQQQVQIDWTSYIDTAVAYYEVQRSYDNISFGTIGTQQAVGQDQAQYARKDTPTVAEGGVVYYRLQWYMKDGRTMYSPIRQVDWTAEDQLIALYPNPVQNGNLFIKWTANTGETMQVAMFDIMGRLIYQNTLIASQWNNNTELQTGRFPTGMYFIKLKIGDKFYERKLIYQ